MLSPKSERAPLIGPVKFSRNQAHAQPNVINQPTHKSALRAHARTMSNVQRSSVSQFVGDQMSSSYQEFLSSLAGLGPQRDADRFNALLDQVASHAKAVPEDKGDGHPLHEHAGVDRLINSTGLASPAGEPSGLGGGGSSGGASAPVPASPPGPQLSEEEVLRRRRVWDWFGGLTIDERDRVFTVVDKAWISLLLTMHAEVKRKGDGVFYFEESDLMVAPVKGKRNPPLGCVCGGVVVAHSAAAVCVPR